MRVLLNALVCFALLLPMGALADSQLRGLAVDATLMPTEDTSEIGSAYWDDLANTGVNFIRLQYSNKDVLDDESAYRAWMATVLDHIDAVLPLAAARNMKVMFSLHSPPEGRRTNEKGIPIDNLFYPGNWGQQVLTDFWATAAAKYNSNTTVAAYLIMGEPAPIPGQNGDWKTLSASLSNTIRTADSTPVADQPAIVIAAVRGNPALASTISIPTDGGTYMASFNMYFPHKYTHQGLYDNISQSYPQASGDVNPRGAAKKCKGLTGRELSQCARSIAKKKANKQCKKAGHTPGSAEFKACKKATKKEIVTQIKQKFGGNNNNGNTEKKKKPKPRTKEGLANAMNKIRRFAEKNGVEVMVAEYSVVAYASGAATYLKDVTDLFNDYGFHSAYHIWREAYVWSLEHTCVNKDNCTPDSNNDRMAAMQTFFSNNAAP